MELRKLVEELNSLLEEDAVATEPVAPVKKDKRSFKYYLKSKISKNDLAWLEGEIDWDNEYRDPDDGYTWYFPLKYSHNANRVAEAVRRNLVKGSIKDIKVKVIESDTLDGDPVLQIKFKNNKLLRETGIDNMSPEYDELIKEFQEQRATGIENLKDFLYSKQPKNESFEDDFFEEYGKYFED